MALNVKRPRLLTSGKNKLDDKGIMAERREGKTVRTFPWNFQRAFSNGKIKRKLLGEV
jgi:hypothetical protein